MPQAARITIVSSDVETAAHLQLRLQSRGYQACIVSCDNSTLGLFYSDPPDLLLIDLCTGSEHGTEIVFTLRSDSFFSAIPIIGLFQNMDGSDFDWDVCPLDDFISLPVDFNELFCRISLALSRLKRIFDNNPLTRLPGNASIQRAIEDSIGKSLAVCYVDINHFKPYNDVFGFSHGDEVIRMTARIMSNAVREAVGGFCGHIGGDDFVCIVPLDQAEGICKTIIDHFDLIVLDLFDDETKKRKTYLGTSRKGDKEEIPILSVSIGVVLMNSPRIQHAAKVAEVAAELKKMAKDSVGSCCVFDQRRA
ncbi:MAG: diguanylate cyclase [Desulfuromonadales bacterium]